MNLFRTATPEGTPRRQSNLIACRGGASLLALALVLSACTGGESSSPSSGQPGGRLTGDDLNEINAGEVKQQGGSVTFAITDDVVNWNPMHAEGNNLPGETIASSIYPAAFTPQPDASVAMNTALLDDAAVETVTDTGQTVVYEISDEARWSDGTPITAADFVYTWTVQNGRDCKECLINATDGFEKVTAVSEGDSSKQVRVQFDAPYINWEGLFKYIYPSHLAEDAGDMAASYNEFFGTTVPIWSGGPWIVEEHLEGREIRLKPNPEWYGDGPSLESLTFKVVSDQEQQITALRNQELDVFTLLADNQIVRQADGLKDEGISYQITEGNRWAALWTNVREGSVLEDSALREALFHTIDVPAILKRVVGPIQEDIKPLGSLVYLQAQPHYQDNATPAGIGVKPLDETKEALENAGYTISGGKLTGPDGETVPKLRLATYRLTVFEDMAKLVLNDLKKLGLDATIVTDPSPNVKYFLPGAFDIAIGPLAARPAEAETKANQTWNSTINGNYDYAGYKNDEVDKLLAAAVESDSQEGAAELMNDADQIMLGDHFVMPLYQIPRILVFRSSLANVRDNPQMSIGAAYSTNHWGFRQ